MSIFPTIKFTLSMPVKQGRSLKIQEWKEYNGDVVSLPKDDVPAYLEAWESAIKAEIETKFRLQRELYRWQVLGMIEFHNLKQNSTLWAIFRGGNWSGSDNPVTKTGEMTKLQSYEYPYKKAVELIYQKYSDMPFLYLHQEFNQNFKGNWYTERGHTLEPVSLEEYRELHKCDIVDDGVITLKGVPHLHYSHDGIVMDNELKLVKVLDVKTKKLWETLMIKDFIEEKIEDFMMDSELELNLGEHIGKRLEDYHIQLQLGMFMTDTDSAEIIIKYERIPNIIYTIKRDERFIYNMVASMNKIIPSITSIYERHKNVFMKETT